MAARPAHSASPPGPDGGTAPRVNSSQDSGRANVRGILTLEHVFLRHLPDTPRVRPETPSNAYTLARKTADCAREKHRRRHESPGLTPGGPGVLASRYGVLRLAAPTHGAHDVRVVVRRITVGVRPRSGRLDDSHHPGPPRARATEGAPGLTHSVTVAMWGWEVSRVGRCGRGWPPVPRSGGRAAGWVGPRRTGVGPARRVRGRRRQSPADRGESR